MELVLVIDASGSMYPYQQELRELARSVHQQFSLGFSWTRVGVVMFSGSAHKGTIIKDLRAFQWKWA